jgi:hypothetical protein
MTNFSEWYMRVEDDDIGSVHDCVWDGDYCKARDVQSILEEAFEAGYDKAGARVKELEEVLMDIQNTLSFFQQSGISRNAIDAALYNLYEKARDILMETNK